MVSQLNIWGEHVPREIFSEAELNYLQSFTDTPLPSLDWIWQEIDRIWDGYGLDNRVLLEKQNIAAFYSHPVWILNSFYTGTDPVSVKHRQSIAKYIETLHPKRIADYGGGGAELARTLSLAVKDASIEIVEPYPSALGKHRVRDLKKIRFVESLTGKYDVIVAQDVLEHVENPIAIVEEINGALNENGTAIFANCFYPVIKCHLPRTFYLRSTFRLIMKVIGFKYLYVLQGAEHAQVFQKQIHSHRFPISISKVEKFSKELGWFLNTAAAIVKKLKKNALQ